MGFITAFDNLLYSMGLSYLPVSTLLGLLKAACFNAIFPYVLVGQKLLAFATNSIVVISTGTVILGVSAKNIGPSGPTQRGDHCCLYYLRSHAYPALANLHKRFSQGKVFICHCLESSNCHTFGSINILLVGYVCAWRLACFVMEALLFA
ncbi:hypothetical protein L7F22_033912 [Adiantum nelumboides]|nr:hypothetical protein [Adiantum nelumboides]